MKKFSILSLIFLMMSLFIPIRMDSDTINPTYSFQAHQFDLTYPEHTKSKDNNNRRAPLAPIFCEISQSNGVCVYGYSENIILYEIWDANGESCLLSFSNGKDFTDTLFTIRGDFQIRLIYYEYQLIGYISTNI